MLDYVLSDFCSGFVVFKSDKYLESVLFPYICFLRLLFWCILRAAVSMLIDYTGHQLYTNTHAYKTANLKVFSNI